MTNTIKAVLVYRTVCELKMQFSIKGPVINKELGKLLFMYHEQDVQLKAVPIDCCIVESLCLQCFTLYIIELVKRLTIYT